MKKKKQRISAERVRDILEMFFSGQLYDYSINEQWGFVDVRYCDGQPLREARRVLSRNLRGWSLHL